MARAELKTPDAPVEVAEVLGYSSTAVTHAATRGGVIFAETPDLGEKLAPVKL